MVTVLSKRFEEEIRNMKNWLSNVEKKNEKSENQVHPTIDVKLFNSSQKMACNIVESHIRNPQNQLLMKITGLSGSEKSFVIDALKALLKKMYLRLRFLVFSHLT